MTLLLSYAVLVAAGWAVAIAADYRLSRRQPPPERWRVFVPGQFPAYVRQDYARARQAARTGRRPFHSPEE